MLDDPSGTREGRGIWLWAIASTLILALLELVFFAALIPTSWAQSAADTELRWLIAAHGPASADAILDRAADWYRTLFVASGIEPWTYQLLAPGPGFEPGAGLEKIGDYPFWDWLRGRLDVIWGTLAQALQRLAVLFAWWPFFTLVLAGALTDGWLRRRIRQHGFAYASPLAHHAAAVALAWLWAIVAFLLLAPIPLPAAGVPVVALTTGALLAVMMAQAQKRL